VSELYISLYPSIASNPLPFLNENKEVERSSHLKEPKTDFALGLAVTLALGGI
jgi:hypothetical protein